MSISLVGTPQSGNALNGGNVTLTFSSVQAGDVIIVGGGHGAAVTTLADPTVSTGTGTVAAINKRTGTAPICGMWSVKVATTSGGSFAISCSGGGSASDAVAYAGYCLRGVDQTNITDATATTAGPTTSTNPNPPAISTVTGTTVPAWVIPMEFHLANSASSAAPANYSNLVANNRSDTNPVGVGMATRAAPATGSEDPGTFTNASNVSWFSITAAIRPVVTLAATGAQEAFEQTAPGVDNRHAASGVEEAFEKGTLAPVTDKPLSGVAETFEAGAPKADLSVALGGLEAAFGTGTITASVSGDVSANMTGSEAALSAGTISVDVSKTLSGAEKSFASGTASASSSVALSGAPAALVPGSVGASASASLSGAALASERGSLSPSGSVALSGASGAFETGAATPASSDVTVALSGLALATAQGAAEVYNGLPLVGLAAAFEQGSVSVAGSKSVALRGEEVRFFPGEVRGSGERGNAPFDHRHGGGAGGTSAPSISLVPVRTMRVKPIRTEDILEGSIRLLARGAPARALCRVATAAEIGATETLALASGRFERRLRVAFSASVEPKTHVRATARDADLEALFDFLKEAA